VLADARVRPDQDPRRAPHAGNPRCSARWQSRKAQGLEMSRFAKARLRVSIWIPLVIILLLGLPLAVWLDLRNLTDEALRRQAIDFNSLITSVRDYYANNVVGRVLANAGSTQVSHNYQAIPVPYPFQQPCRWIWAG